MDKRSILRLVAMTCVAAALVVPAPSAVRADPVVAPGWDLLTTFPTTNFMGVDFLGVPFGSFDFGGSIGVQPTGMADTIVQRLAEANGPSEIIPVELVGLHLMTTMPVDLGLGVGFYFITLQSEHGGPASTGMQTIFFGPEGSPHGTFDSFFDVFFDIRFGSLSGPIVPGFTDPLTLTSMGTPWGHVDPTAFRVQGVNYLLKGDSTTDQDFFPIGSIVEIHPGVGVHTVQPSGPDQITLAVPEPGSLVLLGLGAAGLMGYGWRRKRGQH